jgi:hypothetical protein
MLFVKSAAMVYDNAIKVEYAAASTPYPSTKPMAKSSPHWSQQSRPFRSELRSLKRSSIPTPGIVANRLRAILQGHCPTEVNRTRGKSKKGGNPVTMAALEEPFPSRK